MFSRNLGTAPFESHDSESQRAPDGPSTEDPSTQESHPDHGRVFHDWSNRIKIKHFRRDELIQMGKKHMSWATVADGQTAASWGERKKTASTHPESAFGWVLIGWAALVENHPIPASESPIQCQRAVQITGGQTGWLTGRWGHPGIY